MSTQAHAEEGRADGAYPTQTRSTPKPRHPSQQDEKGSRPPRRNWRTIFDGDSEYDPNQKFNYPDPPKQKSELQIFQNLVGIHFLREGGGLLYPAHQKVLGQQRPVSAMTDIFFASRAAHERFRNRGLYNRCLAQDQKNRVMYGLSNYVISFLYLLQILIAAAITGLSATQTGEVGLTVLGAINTVLAGILAWLNGQGMPTRFRRARDQYREVVKAIEAAERTFAEINYRDWEGDSRPDPFAIRDKLERLYEEARADQESNYPDTQEGPNKNQMENTKRVLEDQIRQHQEEKNKQAGELEKIREEMQGSEDFGKERENAIQQDFDDREARLRELLVKERVKAERAIEALQKMKVEVLEKVEQREEREGDRGGQDREAVTPSQGTDEVNQVITMPTSYSSPVKYFTETMSLPTKSLMPEAPAQASQRNVETHLQRVNRERREEKERNKAEKKKAENQP